MDVEETKPVDECIVIEPEPEPEPKLQLSQQEVEAMVDDSKALDGEAEVEAVALDESRPPRVWPELGTERTHRFQSQINRIRETFEDYVDPFDTAMVSEYSDEIFEYMQELEVSFLVDLCVW